MAISGMEGEIVIMDDQQLIKIGCQGKLIYHEFINTIPFSNNTLNLIIEVANKNFLEKIFTSYIIKINKGNLIPFEDKCWIEKIDVQKLMNVGINTVAYISPVNIFNIYEIQKEINGGLFSIKIFKDESLAFQWMGYKPT